ncbi:DUF6932 family protein [Parvicella tangerina]|uniref:Uncharacterized protein n=1 Tax=Parvicella tangerina TaxID=2829795 RepID=A0A916JMB7_9FLAO|nr:hypothetical protein [Parvicella tangerina]CAG5081304.1 hypothetical protein CRYO30217_01588 [Parvicella tangerina]
MKTHPRRMLTINEAGYLEPNTAIPSDLTEMEKTFVIEYSSVERSALFEMYQQYIEDLKQLCGDTPLRQWINGSFITKRKPRPSDIDMVTFIDSHTVQKLGEKLRPFVYPQSKSNYPGIDAYIVEVYPEDSNKFMLFKSDTAYWHNQFDTTRRNRQGQKEPKGFLEIIH